MSGIKDVAKRAGVGVGTVSRMINNSGYVADNTRERIKTAMQELKYTPNELARNLYHKRTGIIAVLVPNITNPFFAEFVDSIESELYDVGFKMMLCNTVKTGNAELEYLDMLNRHIVDGIITGVHSLDVSEYIKIHKPIVALDRYLGENIPVVSSNHKEGGRLAAQAFLQSGCKHVLHFRGSTVVESPYHERHYEFERIMKANDVKTFPYELEWNRFDPSYFSKVVEDIFSRPFAFDGVFAVDWLAIECMNKCIQKKLRVPDDVKFVAYDGTFITDMVEPKMTSIVQSVPSLAKEAIKLIIDRINGIEYHDKRVVVEVSIRKGETTLS